MQVVEVTREDLRLGGAGNVINNLVALGCQVRVASVLGADDDSQRLRRMLEEKGVDTAGLFFDRERDDQPQDAHPGQQSADAAL